MVLMRQTMMAEMLEMGLDPMAEIRALGYEFRDGKLREVNGNGTFVFQNGSHYDSLADAVAQYVPLLLEEEAHLNPLWLPLGVSPGEGCPIFVSEGYEKAEQLLLIIQGMGRVRAGVWGCSLCINDSLERGTMLPYIRRATASGYGVVVFNPNENTVDDVPVPGSENFNNHVAYVMDKVVPRCAAGKIDILAHSHGGRALLSYLGRAGANNLIEKMHRVIFTDSYHMQMQLAYLPSCVRALLSDPARTVNFVPDPAPLGTQVQQWSSQEYSFSEVEKGCTCLSVGVLDHPSVNYAAMSAVFEFLEAGSKVSTPGPHNLQVGCMESLPALNNINFASTASEKCESNNLKTIFGDASKAELIVASNCKTKGNGNWSKFKHLLRGAISSKACTRVESFRPPNLVSL